MSENCIFLVVLMGVLMTFSIAEYPCVIYDDSAAGVQKIIEYYKTYGANTVSPVIVDDPQDMENPYWKNYTNCNLEHLEFKPDHNITFVIKQKDTLMQIPTQIDDPTVAAWVSFLQTYDSNLGICGNPPTSTVALACRVVSASSYFSSTFQKWLYPLRTRLNITEGNNATTNTSSYPGGYSSFDELKQNTWWLGGWANPKTPDEATKTEQPVGSNYTWNEMGTALGYHIPNIFGYTTNHAKSLLNVLEGGAILSALSTIKNFRTVNKNTSTMYHSFDKLRNHLWKPWNFMSTVVNHPEFVLIKQRFWNRIGNDLEETSRNIDTLLHHYNTMDVTIQGNNEVNGELGPLHDFMSQYNDQSKSLLRAHMIMKFKSKELKHWASLADPVRTFYLYSPTDLYHGIASVGSWLIHANNEYNTTHGCLGRGFIWIPIMGIVCKWPVFKGLTYTNFWPVGFDPYNAQCLPYQDFSIYGKMLIYGIFTPIYGQKIVNNHPGMIPILGWTIYNVTGNQTLPPNTYPCLFVTWTPPIVALSGIFVLFFIYGMFCQITTNFQKKLFGDDDKDEPLMRDITKMIPQSDKLIQQLSAPAQVILTGDVFGTAELFNNSESLIRDSLSGSNNGGGESKMGGLRQRTSKPKLKVPKIKLPKIPKLK